MPASVNEIPSQVLAPSRTALYLTLWSTLVPSSEDKAQSSVSGPKQAEIIGLWFAPRNSLADGNAGAVGFHHRSHHYSGCNNSSGLRAGRQRHVARLCAGDNCDSAGGVVHWPFRALLRFARFSLHLRCDDPADPGWPPLPPGAFCSPISPPGSSVIGGFYQYANICCGRYRTTIPPPY